MARRTPLEIARLGIGVLVVSSIVVPTIFQPLKIAILALILACMLMTRSLWKVRSSPAQAALDLAAIAYCLIGLSWGVYGLMRNTPGAVSMLTVHAAYPVLCIFLGRLAQPGDFERISKVIVVSAGLVIAAQVLFIASFFGLDGGAFFSGFNNALGENAGVVDAGDTYLLFTLPSVSSLLFIAPWALAYVLFSPAQRPRNFALLLATVFLLVLAGRRAFVVGLFFSVVAMFAASRGLRAGRFRGRIRLSHALLFAAVTAGVVAIGLHFDWLNVELLTDRLTSIFDFSDNESNIERRLQFDALFDGFTAHPIFGNGLGASASYLRSDTQPWTYELSYVALLFQFGFAGFLFYSAGVVFLLVQLFRLCTNGALPRGERVAAVAFFGGLVSFLVANATNPYLAKFDYMWTIFVPLALVRAGLGTNSMRFPARHAPATP